MSSDVLAEMDALVASALSDANRATTAAADETVAVADADVEAATTADSAVVAPLTTEELENIQDTLDADVVNLTNLQASVEAHNPDMRSYSMSQPVVMDADVSKEPMEARKSTAPPSASTENARDKRARERDEARRALVVKQQALDIDATAIDTMMRQRTGINFPVDEEKRSHGKKRDDVESLGPLMATWTPELLSQFHYFKLRGYAILQGWISTANGEIRNGDQLITALMKYKQQGGVPVAAPRSIGLNAEVLQEVKALEDVEDVGTGRYSLELPEEQLPSEESGLQIDVTVWTAAELGKRTIPVLKDFMLRNGFFTHHKAQSLVRKPELMEAMIKWRTEFGKNLDRLVNEGMVDDVTKQFVQALQLQNDTRHLRVFTQPMLLLMVRGFTGAQEGTLDSATSKETLIQTLLQASLATFGSTPISSGDTEFERWARARLENTSDKSIDVLYKTHLPSSLGRVSANVQREQLFRFAVMVDHLNNEEEIPKWLSSLTTKFNNVGDFVNLFKEIDAKFNHDLVQYHDYRDGFRDAAFKQTFEADKKRLRPAYQTFLVAHLRVQDEELKKWGERTDVEDKYRESIQVWREVVQEGLVKMAAQLKTEGVVNWGKRYLGITRPPTIAYLEAMGVKMHHIYADLIRLEKGEGTNPEIRQPDFKNTLAQVVKQVVNLRVTVEADSLDLKEMEEPTFIALERRLVQAHESFLECNELLTKQYAKLRDVVTATSQKEQIESVRTELSAKTVMMLMSHLTYILDVIYMLDEQFVFHDQWDVVAASHTFTPIPLFHDIRAFKSDLMDQVKRLKIQKVGESVFKSIDDVALRMGPNFTTAKHLVSDYARVPAPLAFYAGGRYMKNDPFVASEANLSVDEQMAIRSAEWIDLPLWLAREALICEKLKQDYFAAEEQVHDPKLVAAFRAWWKESGIDEWYNIEVFRQQDRLLDKYADQHSGEWKPEEKAIWEAWKASLRAYIQDVNVSTTQDVTRKLTDVYVTFTPGTATKTFVPAPGPIVLHDPNLSAEDVHDQTEEKYLDDPHPLEEKEEKIFIEMTTRMVALRENAFAAQSDIGDESHPWSRWNDVLTTLVDQEKQLIMDTLQRWQEMNSSVVSNVVSQRWAILFSEWISIFNAHLDTIMRHNALGTTHASDFAKTMHMLPSDSLPTNASTITTQLRILSKKWRDLYAILLQAPSPHRMHVNVVTPFALPGDEKEFLASDEKEAAIERGVKEKDLRDQILIAEETRRMVYQDGLTLRQKIDSFDSRFKDLEQRVYNFKFVAHPSSAEVEPLVPLASDLNIEYQALRGESYRLNDVEQRSMHATGERLRELETSLERLRVQESSVRESPLVLPATEKTLWQMLYPSVGLSTVVIPSSYPSRPDFRDTSTVSMLTRIRTSHDPPLPLAIEARWTHEFNAYWAHMASIVLKTPEEKEMAIPTSSITTWMTHKTSKRKLSALFHLLLSLLKHLLDVPIEELWGSRDAAIEAEAWRTVLYYWLIAVVQGVFEHIGIDVRRRQGSTTLSVRHKETPQTTAERALRISSGMMSPPDYETVHLVEAVLAFRVYIHLFSSKDDEFIRSAIVSTQWFHDQDEASQNRIRLNTRPRTMEDDIESIDWDSKIPSRWRVAAVAQTATQAYPSRSVVSYLPPGEHGQHTYHVGPTMASAPEDELDVLTDEEEMEGL